MKFFENYFNNVDFYSGAEEIKVLCPFHSDTLASASINVDKSLFNCLACGVGYNEQQFISNINDISLVDAGKVLSKLEGTQTNEWSVVHEAKLWSNVNMINALKSFGLDEEFMQEMRLGLVEDKLGNERLGIPVFYNKVLMDVRSYDIMKLSSIKMMSVLHTDNGYAIPYDIWRETPKDEITYIFEGEKDMLVARSIGINGITLTGGASAVPNEMSLSAFKDKDFVICYDNDKAGKEGMERLYSYISKQAKSVRYINIGDVVEENKEDLTDAVVKYDMDLWTFLALEEHDFDNIEKEYQPVEDALNTNMIKKHLFSLVTVSGEFEDTYAVPTTVEIIKTEENGKSDTMTVGEKHTWYLEKQNAHQLLELVEADAKKKQVIGKIKAYLGIPTKETGLRVKVSDYATVFKARVSDVDAQGSKLDVYSFNKMSVGENYEINYKIYPHPTKNQKLVALTEHVERVGANEQFRPNKSYLKQFQQGETVKEKLTHLYDSAKFHIAKHLGYKMWLMSDLVFNSILEFDYGDRIRGALDVFVLGDTQVGKSETTSKLTELYDFGHFLSLKTSTTVGLIGGSNKVDNNWLNTIGAIPRQHKKMVVMEEFSGADPSFIKTMTDVRSSGRLRLARAAGELNIACKLRMMTLSNAINDSDGNPRHLNSFPNGIMPLMELIKSSEDVARYDGFLLVPKPENRFNPFGVKVSENPILKEVYKHKINWVYTRKPEDVIISEEVKSYIWEKAEGLNKLFECNFPLFGTTTSLKLARFSVAMASLIVNTDETYEKVIVTEDIVDEAYKFLVDIYDNDIFKLREYKKEYDSYSKLSKKEEKEMQDLYSKNSTLFEWINNTSAASRNDLRTISGLDGDSFNPLFNRMVALKLVRISGTKIFPTPKFRIGMRRIDKSIILDTGQSMIGKNDKSVGKSLTDKMKGKG
jgi:hypothetical protein